ncbi:MAG: BON domain-containing protein [Burkholderiaceae bacterium]
MQAIARAALVAALVGMSAGLAGCFTAAATGIVVGGLAAIDRRTIGAQTEDQAIELKAHEALRANQLQGGGISVTSFNRRVLLSGQAENESVKARATEVVRGIENVVEVHNELDIAGRASFGSSVTDTSITTRVKTALLNSSEVPGNSVKVVTEKTTVYLMGLVTAAEADAAARIASRTSGVARVVTVFELISPEEARRLDGRASSG